MLPIVHLKYPAELLVTFIVPVNSFWGIFWHQWILIYEYEKIQTIILYNILCNFQKSPASAYSKSDGNNSSLTRSPDFPKSYHFDSCLYNGFQEGLDFLQIHILLYFFSLLVTQKYDQAIFGTQAWFNTIVITVLQVHVDY